MSESRVKDIIFLVSRNFDFSRPVRGHLLIDLSPYRFGRPSSNKGVVGFSQESGDNSSSSIGSNKYTASLKSSVVSTSSGGVSFSSSWREDSCDSVGHSGLYSSSFQPRHGAGAALVHGESPLEIIPSLAARKVLRTLRVYVSKLRVTKDNEARAEE